MKKGVLIIIMISLLSFPVHARGFSESTQILSVKDGMIFSGDKEIVLKGVNLGSWLIMESWMSPILDIDETMAYSDIIKILSKRFGAKKTDELIKLYEDNFITEKDFERIKKMGFNCVRVPIWYQNFMNEDTSWRLNARGFELIDKAVKECKKNGLYLIIDMHGCPGGQSTNHSTGTIGKNELYYKESNLKAMQNLWTEIAKRYKNNATVAAYDIMNEPFNNNKEPFPESEEAVSKTNAVYKRMIEAIRKVDKNHIISIEGIWTMDVLPNPKDYGFENMMYQLHIYDKEKEMIDKRIDEMKRAREEFGVAVYVGEHNSRKNEDYALLKYDENKISHTKWTYKTIGVNYDNWGIYNKDFEKVDIKNDSFEKIKDAFSKQVRTENGFYKW